MEKHQSGFTILEAVIAFAILSIGLLASMKMMTNTMAGSQVARQRMEAMTYATNQLEDLRATGVCAAVPPTVQTQTVQSTTQYTLQVTCVGNAATITVTWNDLRGGQAQVNGADNQVVLDSQL